MSECDWSSLPLLPLTCILNHLSTEDAFKAMSTCRHWRDAALLYEGRRETIKLPIRNLQKCKFLVRLFKKSVRRLHFYIDCNEYHIEKFMDILFPHVDPIVTVAHNDEFKDLLKRLFEIADIQELLFVGPSYVQHSAHLPSIELGRVMIETLLYKNRRSLTKLGFFGCSLAVTKCENEKYNQRIVERYAKPLDFHLFSAPESSILTRDNDRMLSSLTHIISDIDQLNTETLETLASLRHLRYVSINITNKKLLDPYPDIDWFGLEDYYTKPLRVGINIIGMPYRRFHNIMEKVLVEGIPLVSIKVMFCKSLYTPLISHVARLYQDSIREVVWVDSPYDSTDPYHRVVRPKRHITQDAYAHVNPFVLMCWQCSQLQRLVIHGYWIWQYDVLGFVRLRKDLKHLEVSAIYYKQDKFQNLSSMSEEGAIRVLCGDSQLAPNADHIREVNEFMERPWSPQRWSELHPALRHRSTNQHRNDYVIRECRAVLGLYPRKIIPPPTFEDKDKSDDDDDDY